MYVLWQNSRVVGNKGTFCKAKRRNGVRHKVLKKEEAKTSSRHIIAVVNSFCT